MASANIKGRAIVTRGPHTEGKWKIEDVYVRPLKENELLVEMAASGICHTDILLGDNADRIGGYPRVVGHEGSGYVKQIGSAVTGVQPGDPVLLSFTSCGDCQICRLGVPTHCTSMNKINFNGNKCFSSTNEDDYEITGSFFGQSSFASLSVVSERSVVNAKDLIKSPEELRLFAPLGCGIQTGAGTVVNVAKATDQDTVCVIGLGGVGLAAVMGAALCGCRKIIGIDKVASRLELGRELGCSHVIDTSSLSELNDLVQEVQKVTDGYGTTVTVDTTGVAKLVNLGVDFTANYGQYIQVGTAPPDAKFDISVVKLMQSGKRLIGAVEGQVIPQEFVPRMIGWYRDGRFPLEKLVKFFKVEEFEKAIEEMHDGRTIKPIITWLETK